MSLSGAMPKRPTEARRNLVVEVIELSDTETTGAVATNSQVADVKSKEEVQPESEEGNGDHTVKLPDETTSGKNELGADIDEPDNVKPTDQDDEIKRKLEEANLHLLFLHEHRFLVSDEPDTFQGVNDWAQREIDAISFRLDELFTSGKLQAASDLHKLTEEELSRRFPIQNQFGHGFFTSDDEMDPMIQVAEETVETGRFPAHGGLGSAWQRAKQKNKKLKDDYEAIDGNQVEQEKMRVLWVKEQYLPANKSRKKTTKLKKLMNR